MTLMIGGTQGAGVDTFAKRAENFGLKVLDMNVIYRDLRSSMKTKYSRLAGPYQSTASEIEEFSEHFSTLISALDPERYNGYDLWSTSSVELLEWIHDNDDRFETMLITCPLETQCLRLFEKEKLLDPRLTGKSHAYQLVKPEILKELASHEDAVTRLEEKVDVHIVNNGTIEQYNATIDNLLNERNLLH